MLDQLLSLVKENAQDAVANNPEVPSEHHEGIMQEAANSITGGLKQELANGGFQNVLKTLGGKAGTTGDPSIVNNISGNFMNSIMQKFGLKSQTAQSIAASVIPAVMGSLVKKTNDPNDSSFDLGGIFNSLTGGKASGLNMGSILQSVTQGGLDKNHDGSVNLADLTSMFSGSVQGQQDQPATGEQKDGGGIMGALKGMLGGK